MSKLSQVISSFRTGLAGLITGKGWQDAYRQDAMFGTAGKNGQLTKPYGNSAWVFRAVQHIAGPISSVPFVFSTNGQAIKDAAMEEFWARPAEGIEGPMSAADFKEATVVWLSMNGQAFWLLDDSWLTRTRNKSRIILARPDRMRPIMRSGVLLGWTFQDGGGRSHTLLPEQVVRPHYYNPYDELAGLAPWMAAEIAAQSDYAAGIFAKNLMESNGDRGVYVIAKNGVPTDEQREQIIAQLRQKREMNRRGDFRPAFLTGEISIEDPKLQGADAAFVAQRKENRHEIFIAFGVPASMAEVTASYSVGSASDRYRLIEETCMPCGVKISEAVELVEMRRSGRTLMAALDWSNHSTMQAVREERVKSAETLFKMGVPVKTANEWLGLGLAPFKGWEVGYLPMSLQPTGEVEGDGNNPPAPSEQPDDSTLAAGLRKSLSDFEALIRSGPPACCPGHGHKSGGERDPERVKLWEKHMKLQAAAVKMYKVKFAKCIAEIRKEMLQKLEATKSLEGVRTKGLLDIIFDLSKFTARIVAALRDAAEYAITQAAEQLSQELGLDDPWKVEDPEVIAIIEDRENKIKDVAQEVFEEIKDTIQEGLEAGDSNAQIAAAIKAKCDDISDAKAAAIAQTEVTSAYNRVRYQGLKESGVEYKEWLTAQDEKVRAPHVVVDGDVVPIESTFTVDGEELVHPGDPDGGPANVINCRCVLVAARKPKETT